MEQYLFIVLYPPAYKVLTAPGGPCPSESKEKLTEIARRAATDAVNYTLALFIKHGGSYEESSEFLWGVRVEVYSLPRQMMDSLRLLHPEAQTSLLADVEPLVRLGGYEV